MLFVKQVSYRLIYIHFLIEPIVKSPILELCVAEIYHHSHLDAGRFQIIQKLGEVLLGEILNSFRFNKNYTFDNEIGDEVTYDNTPETNF